MDAIVPLCNNSNKSVRLIKGTSLGTLCPCAPMGDWKSDELMGSVDAYTEGTFGVATVEAVSDLPSVMDVGNGIPEHCPDVCGYSSVRTYRKDGFA